jgi:hypothetical protein
MSAPTKDDFIVAEGSGPDRRAAQRRVHQHVMARCEAEGNRTRTGYLAAYATARSQAFAHGSAAVYNATPHATGATRTPPPAAPTHTATNIKSLLLAMIYNDGATDSATLEAQLRVATATIPKVAPDVDRFCGFVAAIHRGDDIHALENARCYVERIDRAARGAS